MNDSRRISVDHRRTGLPHNSGPRINSRSGTLSEETRLLTSGSSINIQFNDIVFSPRILVPTAVIVFFFFAAVVRGDDNNAVLQWASGDSLPGKLIRITSDEVLWESSIFATPLRLERSVLSTVSFEPGNEAPPTIDNFRIVLTTGDTLFGRLKSLDSDHLKLSSTRHGEVRIPRILVAGIQRVNQEGLIYLGPAGRSGWSGPNIEKNWDEQTDGSLTSSTDDALLTLGLRTEKKLSVEIILSFVRRPEFVLALGPDDETSIRLETWGDALVVCSQLEFLEIQTMDNDTTQIHLLLYLDMESERLLVCSPQGEVLATHETPNPKQMPRTLSLRNGSGTVTLQHLRIERWNGNSVGSLAAGRTGIQQVDGTVHHGTGVSITDRMIRLQNESGETGIPVELTGSLEISTDIPKESTASVKDTSRIKWRDGGALCGHIINMTETVATIRPAWSEQPISANPQGIQVIDLGGKASAVSAPDELIVGGRLLHGHLVVDDGEQPLTWKPTGSADGIPLRSGDDAVVTRSTKTSPVVIDPQKYPDIIYLRNHDVIPCRLQSITGNTVMLASPFTSAKQFFSNDIQALELSSTQQRSSLGFADSQWKRIRGKIKQEGGQVQLISGSFGSENGIPGDRLNFDAQWPPDQWTFMKVHLFADHLHQPKTASACTLIFGQNVVAVTQEFDRQNPFATIQNQKLRIPTKGHSAQIQLVTNRGNLKVLINGQLLRTFPLNRAGAGNEGVLFELLQSGTGQFFGARSRNGATTPTKTVRHLTLSNLQTGPTGGVSAQKFIDEESRLHTLTIPRFRRNDPATHALIAPNGDVLRGRLIAVHEDDVEFESRLEVFHFPRERVAAVIWIQNPEKNRNALSTLKKERPSRVDSSMMQTVLHGGYLVSMTPAHVTDGLLHGESNVLGNCSVPANAISRLHLGNPNERKHTAVYSQWRAKHAVEPDWNIANNNGGNSTDSKLVGRAAPDFALPQVNGKTFRLSDHAGRVVFLDFWASWCVPCAASLQDYADTTKRFDESELVFVAVNIEDSPQTIRAFLKEHQLDVRVAVDRGSAVASQYQVRGIPHSLIIGPGGIIEYVRIGYEPDAAGEIQRVVREILSGTWKRQDSVGPDSNTAAE